MKRESLSGLLLIACAILAMAISNSPFGPVYERWLQAPLPAGTHMSLPAAGPGASRDAHVPAALGQ